MIHTVVASRHLFWAENFTEMSCSRRFTLDVDEERTVLHTPQAFQLDLGPLRGYERRDLEKKKRARKSKGDWRGKGKRVEDGEGKRGVERSMKE